MRVFERSIFERVANANQVYVIEAMKILKVSLLDLDDEDDKSNDDMESFTNY